MSLALYLLKCQLGHFGEITFACQEDHLSKNVILFLNTYPVMRNLNEQFFDKEVLTKEQVPTPQEKNDVDQKESEPSHFVSYEIKDKDGNRLCQINLELKGGVLSRNNASLNRYGQTQEIRSIALEQNGKTINLLDLTQMSEPVQIYMHSETHSHGFFSPDSRNIVIPRPDNPIRIAIALHELGHAKQYENPFFKNQKRTKKDLAISWEDDPRDKLNLLKELIPELDKKISEIPKEIMDHLLEIRLDLASNHSRINTLDLKLRKVSDQIEDLLADPNDPDPIFASFFDEKTHPNAHDPNWQKQILQLRQEGSLIREELVSLKEQQGKKENEFEMIILPIRDLLKTPSKIEERDATRRAFQWMESIREQIDTDLAAAPINPHEYELPSDSPCSESTTRLYSIINKQSEQKTKDVLLRALGTYDALDRIPMPKNMHDE